MEQTYSHKRRLITRRGCVAVRVGRVYQNTGGFLYKRSWRIERLFEGCCLIKHKTHIPHIGHVPFASAVESRTKDPNTRREASFGGTRPMAATRPAKPIATPAAAGGARFAAPARSYDAHARTAASSAGPASPRPPATAPKAGRRGAQRCIGGVRAAANNGTSSVPMAAVP